MHKFVLTLRPILIRSKGGTFSDFCSRVLNMSHSLPSASARSNEWERILFRRRRLPPWTTISRTLSGRQFLPRPLVQTGGDEVCEEGPGWVWTEGCLGPTEEKTPGRVRCRNLAWKRTLNHWHCLLDYYLLTCAWNNYERNGFDAKAGRNVKEGD